MPHGAAENVVQRAAAWLSDHRRASADFAHSPATCLVATLMGPRGGRLRTGSAVRTTGTSERGGGTYLGSEQEAAQGPPIYVRGWKDLPD